METRFLTITVLCFSLLMLFASCSDSGTTPLFTINEYYGDSYDINDESGIADTVSVVSGEEVRLKYYADSSSVTRFSWSVGGNVFGTGASSIFIPKTQVDSVFKIVLCVNDDENCKCRYLKVTGAPDVVAPLPPEPEMPEKSETPALQLPPSVKDKPKPEKPDRIKNPPVSPVAEVMLDKKASVGLPKDMESSVMSCGESGAERFSARLVVKGGLVELTSFKVFVNGCGQLTFSLSGNGTDIMEIFTLTRGKNLLQLSALGARLSAGSYDITLSTAMGGGCTDKSAPKFVNATACDDANERTHSELTLDQNGNKYIHELKFSYK